MYRVYFNLYFYHHRLLLKNNNKFEMYYQDIDLEKLGFDKLDKTIESILKDTFGLDSFTDHYKYTISNHHTFDNKIIIINYNLKDNINSMNIIPNSNNFIFTE